MRIEHFSGAYRFLSNFFPSVVLFEGHCYASVEHAYQAAKAHPSERGQFRVVGLTAGQAKRLGRRVALRADWEQVKLAVMASLLADKFNDATLRALLIDTGDAELVEGNTWGDRYWGVCAGVGENHLGRLLMERRAVLVQCARATMTR